MSSFPTPGIGKGRPPALSANKVGAKEAVAGLEVIEHGGPYGMRHTELRLTNVAVTLVDNGTTGSGGLKLYTASEGVIEVFGAVADLTYASGSFTDAGLVSSMGTVTAAADGTLTSTEADIIQSTASAMSGGAGTNKMVRTGAPGKFVGTSTPMAWFLNMASANDPVGNKTIIVSGTILVHWMNYGDN